MLVFRGVMTYACNGINTRLRITVDRKVKGSNLGRGTSRQTKPFAFRGKINW